MTMSRQPFLHPHFGKFRFRSCGDFLSPIIRKVSVGHKSRNVKIIENESATYSKYTNLDNNFHKRFDIPFRGDGDDRLA